MSLAKGSGKSSTIYVSNLIGWEQTISDNYSELDTTVIIPSGAFVSSSIYPIIIIGSLKFSGNLRA